MANNVFANPIVGKGSWFGNAPGWYDAPMYDRPNSTASGQMTSVPGIAMPSRATLGQMFQVTAPNGQTYTLPQIDVGPGTQTGRAVDISAGAAAQMGYTPKNFPTDSQFTIKPLQDAMQQVKNAAFGITPGRNPNLAKVNPLLVQAVRQGAASLPAGYTVDVNEGYNPNGHVAGSQHHVAGMGALDVQILDPKGNAIPNRGPDSTGLYTQLAKGAYQAANQLGVGDKFAWGGRFATVTGGSTPDLMHFDLGGDRGHFTPPLAQMFGGNTQVAMNNLSAPPPGKDIFGHPWQFPAMRQATPFDTAPPATPGVPANLPPASPDKLPFVGGPVTNPAQLALNVPQTVNPFGAAGPSLGPSPQIGAPPVGPANQLAVVPNTPASAPAVQVAQNTPQIPQAPQMAQGNGLLGGGDQTGGANIGGILGALGGLSQQIASQQQQAPAFPPPQPVHPPVNLQPLIALLQNSPLARLRSGQSAWSLT